MTTSIIKLNRASYRIMKKQYRRAAKKTNAMVTRKISMQIELLLISGWF